MFSSRSFLPPFKIKDDFLINVNDLEEQFNIVRGMSGIKKIISFGGWAFSTEPATEVVLRLGVLESSRDVLANAVVAFWWRTALTASTLTGSTRAPLISRGYLRPGLLRIIVLPRPTRGRTSVERDSINIQSS
jgi:hypothetical protein